MWERACSRIRWISHITSRLMHGLREQARSHIIFVLPVRLRYRPPVALKPTPITVNTDKGNSSVSSNALAGRSRPG